MQNFESNNDFKEKQDKWREIEELVMQYKLKFEYPNDEKILNISKNASEELLVRFTPLFKKYSLLLTTGQIDFNDVDVKSFIGTFIDDPRLHRALKRQRSKAEYRADIYKKFGFVLETYGKLSEDEILVDLQMLLLVLAKRYKQMGKNFCTYVHNCFRYEVSRYIKDFIKNPIVIRNKYNIDKESITEKILQRLILEDIPSFLKELGEGFTFVENEYKIKIGNTYNYIDILLFNYIYNCFVVIELKVTELKKEHIGQIEVYMNYVDKNIKTINQDKTIGVIICKKDNGYYIEYSSDSRIYHKEYILN